VAQALSLCGFASSRFALLRAGLRQQGGAARPSLFQALRAWLFSLRPADAFCGHSSQPVRPLLEVWHRHSCLCGPSVCHPEQARAQASAQSKDLGIAKQSAADER